MTWREYHNATKHSVESPRRERHFLDWANMPDPFRHYEGARLLDLPADPPVPEKPACDGPTFLSQLLFYSAAISASKRVLATGYRYALRVNPSSGNLHPTEFHFITRGLKHWPDGLYHYRPSSHMAEQRARGDVMAIGNAPITFVLTSIAWREAWKYRNRAYRYCLHDMGHAWQALSLAGRAMGCESEARGQFPDDEISRCCRLSKDEWPMLIVSLRGWEMPVSEPDTDETAWSDGEANRLSAEETAYPLIENIHEATKAVRVPFEIETASTGQGEIRLPPPAVPALTFGEVARVRRSALDFQGSSRPMSLPQLSAILASTSEPLPADFTTTRFVQLYVYAHRVDGLEPGVYRHWPDSGGLEQIKSGDQQVMAAALSLGQELAGNACVAFSMIADLDRCTRTYGDRGYRYAHFEAGAIGHRLYLAAEAQGLRATGIGAFYDNEVHRYLDIPARQGQVIYHFAIGHAVPDPRCEAAI